MKTNKKNIVVLLALLMCVMPVLAEESTSNRSAFTQEPYEILFIGSSYFNYNNLPGLFENLAISSGNEVYIDQYIPSGLYLSDHASSSITEVKINEKDWDYVILQGVGSVTAYPDSFTLHPVYPALVTLQNKIHENCASTKMVFCLPWAFEDGMTWYGWPDTYSDMQIKIYNKTLLYSNNLDFPIAPVGWAWYAVLDELNYPLHYLHMSDWNHPSLRGSYLMACTIFSAIFKESTLGNEYCAGLPEDEANYFQNVASNTVLDSLYLWNITTTNMYQGEFLKPNGIHLQQNYPNPFNPITKIKYSIPQSSNVVIKVFDLLGNEITTLVNEEKPTGNYSIEFNAANLPSGVYFYRLNAGEFISTKKMILLK